MDNKSKQPDYRAISYYPTGRTDNKGQPVDESVEVGAVWVSDKGDLSLQLKSGIVLPRDTQYRYKKIWLFPNKIKGAQS